MRGPGNAKNHHSNLQISDEQKHVVKKTWKLLSNDMAGHGSEVFLRIFQLYPHVKQLFPCRDAEGEELLHHPTFKGHASRFMQAVGAAVDNIDDLDEALRPLLIGLGRQHIHFKGFRPDYFNAFTESMMYVWQQELKEKFTDFAKEAWKTVFDFIMGTLKEGFFLALDEAGMTVDDV
ncbi:neuroglobin-like [Liolophura sinensis]|uniref:neuroglobin-like n=1 Tax=Liolophura sinensis TaxID=3198878 RepID=UPI0031595591